MRSAFFIVLLSVLLLACGNEDTPAAATDAAQDTTAMPSAIILTQLKDIPVPAGYARMQAAEHSFAAWLRDMPLKKSKTVYLYNGSIKPNQQAQFAVIDISTGDKDLQQCADVVMRLRAEYLFAGKKYNEIAFMDYSGKWYTWNGGSDRAAFDQYLQKVFGWCGSASLEKQLMPVAPFHNIQTGDVLVMGGFPGHAVLVSDMAVNNKGEKIFLLVQGYQPAQDMHVLINPADPELSPWYRIPTGEDIYTPEWRFGKIHLRRWGGSGG